VHRTYIDRRTPPPSDADTAVIREAARAAQRNAPEVDPRLLDLVADLFVLGTGEDVATADAEFRARLTSMPLSPNEASEFRNLEQTYATLAENEEWMAVNSGKTIQRGEDRDEAPL